MGRGPAGYGAGEHGRVPRVPRLSRTRSRTRRRPQRRRDPVSQSATRAAPAADAKPAATRSRPRRRPKRRRDPLSTSAGAMAVRAAQAASGADATKAAVAARPFLAERAGEGGPGQRPALAERGRGAKADHATAERRRQGGPSHSSRACRGREAGCNEGDSRARPAETKEAAAARPALVGVYFFPVLGACFFYTLFLAYFNIHTPFLSGLQK